MPNHPAFSKNPFSHSGLDMLAETLACLDDPTPPPAATGHFLADGSLLYSDGGGILKGLTPVPVNINSVASVVQQPIDSSASHCKPSVAPPKPGAGKPHYPGATEDGSTSHNPGTFLLADNGGSNVIVPKSKKKGRKAAVAFPQRRTAADANGSGGGGDGNANTSKKKKTPKWTKEEDDNLRQAVEADTNKRWKSIANIHFAGSRTSEQCRARWNNHLDPEVSKAPFSAEEDGIIQEKVAEGKSLPEIAKLLPGRNFCQVRSRFETIRPHKKGQWTESETKILIEKHAEFGNKWTKIAPYIEGRTAIQVKDRWHKSQEKQQKVQEEVESEE